MPRLHVSDEARSNMAAIADWIRRDRPAAARRVGQKLRNTFRFLAQNPDAGERREDIRRGIRVFVPGAPASRYLIFYQVDDEQGVVEISAVVDGSRDWESLMSE